MNKWPAIACIGVLLCCMAVIARFDPFAWKNELWVRIFVACPIGNALLLPEDLTDAGVGTRNADDNTVELWLGLNREAAATLDTLAALSANDECGVFLGWSEFPAFSIDPTQAVEGNMLTLQHVPTEFAERFADAVD